MNRSIGVCLGIASGVLALVAAGLPGCASETTRRVVVEGVAGTGSGPLALDIQNQLGEVEVQIDPTCASPVVEAIPLVLTRPMGQIDRESSFKPWTAAQVAEDEGGRRVLRVLCTAAENQPPRPVYLLVRVPACEGVRVKNVGGPVTLTEVGGAIEVSCTPSTPLMWTDGSTVTVRTSRALTSEVTISSTDGAVSLTMPTTSAGAIEVIAPDTAINLAAVPGDQETGRTRTNLRGAYFGSLNSGQNAISLRSGVRVIVETTTPPPVLPVRHAEAAAAPDTPSN